MPIRSLLAQWYFHVPNLIMAALIYLLAGRAVLELVFAGRYAERLVAILRRLTAPLVRMAGAVTPAAVPSVLVILAAIFWLIAARMFWFMICTALGMRPSLGG